MADYVAWLFELEVRKGQEAELKTLMDEMVSATYQEAGTLMYEWSFSEDGRRVFLYERYTGSAAAMTHLHMFSTQFEKRFFGALDPKRLALFGSPSDELKQALASPILHVVTQRAGFNKG